ncbi:MAG: hypothetical protein KGZ25_12195, partial [Planctomycetes bacterium]|nr:hypothetical protein [Planctomycetota bacterium]
HKKTLQRQIRLAHEQGFAVSTYGKFVMSGSKGWKTTYDYPEDHRSQYHYPVGMWNGVNVLHLDRRRDRDFCIYSKLPRVSGNPFRNWWSSFMPINPDATPHMVRIAAEECVRSIEMFGWDAIRWDGHPRGAGWAQCGRSGKYRPFAARQTQSLVRYFKDIVAQKYPDFRHGYNYLLIEKGKDHKWAIEDFELDELCRGGGLLMNESIGNASGGWTFAQIAKNLQTDGDLCRERGGYYLGISYAKSRRDRIIESALWSAAGCRPYNQAMNREIRRYCTRYSQYTFDENLRRLVTPEKVLKPQNKTRLWWKPFVYETPLQNGRRQFVVNLLNIPQKETRPGRDSDAPPEFDMPPGTDPVAFELSLPEGVEATGVNLIHPRTLDVTALPLADGRFGVPAVRTWKVAVIDLIVQGDVGALASCFGPPATLGKKREDIDDTKRKEQIILDPDASMKDVNKQFSRLAPEWALRRAEKRAAMRELSWEERKKALLDRRTPPQKLAKKWWHGAAIPADLKLKDKKLDFGDLPPQRNGRFDIFYGRGAMGYRLRVPVAFARLNRFKIHNAWLYGAVRQRPGMGLANNIPAHGYSDFDLALFAGIPHCAIGVKNSYALAQYVKSGGGILFTGGEYAFGKGGYMHTVLERELLPFRCTGMTDTTYPKEPRPFEPGPDFSELEVNLDFSQRPVYWVRNQVVLRPDVKVFLKSGNRPVLVGWQVGKGRVTCLLVDHRGKSSDGTTAFFDWQDWPKLLKSAMGWTAPGAGEVEAPEKVADTEYLLDKLGSTSLDSELDDLGGLDGETGGAGLGLPGEKDSGAGTELEPEKLKKRIGLINKALEAKGPKIASALATQLATVTNLPLGLRLRIVSFLQQERPGNAAKLAQKALSTASSRLHGNAYLLLALAGDVSFRKILSNPPSLRLETRADARERRRDLSLAIALYPKADLVEEGREKVKKWNKEEARTRAAYARRLGPDTAMLETSPCLGAEKIFARLAWLAYLSRHEPATYAEQFVTEWVMVRQYQDYCARTRSYMIGQNKLEGAKAAAVRRNWRHLSRRFASLQELTRHDIERLLEEMPTETVSALKGARFTREIQTIYNLLGSVAPESSAKILQDLQGATRGDLATFAAARLSER